MFTEGIFDNDGDELFPLPPYISPTKLRMPTREVPYIPPNSLMQTPPREDEDFFLDERYLPPVISVLDVAHVNHQPVGSFYRLDGDESDDEEPIIFFNEDTETLQIDFY